MVLDAPRDAGHDPCLVHAANERGDRHALRFLRDLLDRSGSAMGEDPLVIFESVAGQRLEKLGVAVAGREGVGSEFARRAMLVGRKITFEVNNASHRGALQNRPSVRYTSSPPSTRLVRSTRSAAADNHQR